ncbi:MAG: hypothetical protein J6U93_01400, partial [Alistipes sp.]|nr:hypothetical protein [Alistipes sp.]
SISKILLNGICTSKAIRGKSPKRMSERNKSLAHFKIQKAPLFASLPKVKTEKFGRTNRFALPNRNRKVQFSVYIEVAFTSS